MVPTKERSRQIETSDEPNVRNDMSDFNDKTPAELDNDERLVGVSFYGRDWVLTIAWPTSPDTLDETRITAAAEWFADKYGFNPNDHALRADVRPVPPKPQN